MRLIKYLFLLAIVSSCGSPKAVYDYDENKQFSEITTYQIFPDLLTGVNQLDEKRLINILSEELTEEGLVPSDDPDIYVNFYAAEYKSQNQSGLGVGLGGTGRNIGVGVAGGIPIGGPDTYLELTFDFIDVDEDALIWQAVVDSRFDPNASPEQRSERLRAMVEKALEGYPPKR